MLPRQHVMKWLRKLPVSPLAPSWSHPAHTVQPLSGVHLPIHDEVVKHAFLGCKTRCMRGAGRSLGSMS